MRGLAALLLLAACGAGPDDASNEAIANRAETLERAADASTDQLIAEIEAQSNADIAAEVEVEAQTVPANATE